MSKKISELEELLKLLEASSLSDIRLIMKGTCDSSTNYVLGIIKPTGNEDHYVLHFQSTTLCIIRNNKFIPVYILYNTDGINSGNANLYTETFKYNKCTFGTTATIWGSLKFLLITDDILRLLDNNVTVITGIACD